MLVRKKTMEEIEIKKASEIKESKNSQEQGKDKDTFDIITDTKESTSHSKTKENERLKTDEGNLKMESEETTLIGTKKTGKKKMTKQEPKNREKKKEMVKKQRMGSTTETKMDDTLESERITKEISSGGEKKVKEQEEARNKKEHANEERKKDKYKEQTREKMRDYKKEHSKDFTKPIHSNPAKKYMRKYRNHNTNKSFSHKNNKMRMNKENQQYINYPPPPPPPALSPRVIAPTTCTANPTHVVVTPHPRITQEPAVSSSTLHAPPPPPPPVQPPPPPAAVSASPVIKTGKVILRENTAAAAINPPVVSNGKPVVQLRPNTNATGGDTGSHVFVQPTGNTNLTCGGFTNYSSNSSYNNSAYAPTSVPTPTPTISSYNHSNTYTDSGNYKNENTNEFDRKRRTFRQAPHSVGEDICTITPTPNYKTNQPYIAGPTSPYTNNPNLQVNKNMNPNMNYNTSLPPNCNNGNNFNAKYTITPNTSSPMNVNDYMGGMQNFAMAPAILRPVPEEEKKHIGFIEKANTSNPNLNINKGYYPVMECSYNKPVDTMANINIRNPNNSYNTINAAAVAAPYNPITNSNNTTHSSNMSFSPNIKHFSNQPNILTASYPMQGPATHPFPYEQQELNRQAHYYPPMEFGDNTRMMDSSYGDVGNMDNNFVGHFDNRRKYSSGTSANIATVVNAAATGGVGSMTPTDRARFLNYSDDCRLMENQQNLRKPFSVIVTNIPKNLNSQEIYEIFKSTENVLRAKVMTATTGASLGCASLVFPDYEAAHRAYCKYDGGSLNGKKIRVYME